MTTTLSPLVDQAAFARTYDVLVTQGRTEVRSLDATTHDNSTPRTFNCYFDCPIALAESVSWLTSAMDTYLTPNVLAQGEAVRLSNALAPIGVGEPTKCCLQCSSIKAEKASAEHWPPAENPTASSGPTDSSQYTDELYTHEALA
jgi:hypothetical protein